jgi:hypothetical protein
MTTIHFSDDDEAYLSWAAANPRGYVINLRRRFDPTYVVLHRANCPSILRYPRMETRPGGFTARDYTKLCGNSETELRSALRTMTGRETPFSKRCARCL